jgi:hypothetical protein
MSEEIIANVNLSPETIIILKGIQNELKGIREELIRQRINDYIKEKYDAP